MDQPFAFDLFRKNGRLTEPDGVPYDFTRMTLTNVLSAVATVSRCWPHAGCVFRVHQAYWFIAFFEGNRAAPRWPPEPCTFCVIQQ